MEIFAAYANEATELPRAQTLLWIDERESIGAVGELLPACRLLDILQLAHPLSDEQ